MNPISSNHLPAMVLEGQRVIQGGVQEKLISFEFYSPGRIIASHTNGKKVHLSITHQAPTGLSSKQQFKRYLDS